MEQLRWWYKIFKNVLLLRFTSVDLVIWVTDKGIVAANSLCLCILALIKSHKFVYFQMCLETFNSFYFTLYANQSFAIQVMLNYVLPDMWLNISSQQTNKSWTNWAPTRNSFGTLKARKLWRRYIYDHAIVTFMRLFRLSINWKLAQNNCLLR